MTNFRLILLDCITYVTWLRGMSRMLRILILSYRHKEVTNSYVFHCFKTSKIARISATGCLIEMGFGSKCSILHGQVIYAKKSKLNTADMWLIPFDRVTYMWLYLPHQAILGNHMILCNQINFRCHAKQHFFFQNKCSNLFQNSFTEVYWQNWCQILSNYSWQNE